MDSETPVVLTSKPVFTASPGAVVTKVASLRNITTNTEPRNANDITICELDEDRISLRVPRGTCAKGHSLLVELAFADPKNATTLNFSSTCSVTRLEKTDVVFDLIDLKLMQYGKKQWHDCMWLLLAEQNEASEMLRLIRDCRPDSVLSESDVGKVKTYLHESLVLLADCDTTMRTAVQNIFCDLGTPAANIYEAPEFNQAEQEINRIRPHIVVADYGLDQASGLDLARHFRSSERESQCRLFVLMTSSHSQGLVAAAAEEDIDAYIVKPISGSAFRKSIVAAAVDKVLPSPYLLAIEHGKKFLQRKQLAEAEKCLSKALALDPQPALACYYLGQIEVARDIHARAESWFRDGLRHKKTHAKCLAGLYDILLRTGNLDGAYDALKRLCQYFPPNHRQLEDILRLSIQLRKYEDVEKYYAVFRGLGSQNPTLAKYVCAALTVCGKYYLTRGNRSRALDLLEKSAETCRGNPSILREIVRVALEHRLSKEALHYLEMFPENSRATDEYRSLHAQARAEK